MSRWTQRLTELRDTLAAHLSDSDLNRVLVTWDPRELVRQADIRAGVILIHAGPALAWPQPGVVRLTWTLTVLVPPADDPLAVMDRLDTLTTAVTLWPHRGLITEAEPDQFAVEQRGDPLPGYRLTLTEDHYQ